ncbi:MAG: hypothetical protein KJ767_02000 [Nanoarchaeota archaeon]|nr:hypothetical protein [Nanoarchaeota archaeon]
MSKKLRHQSRGEFAKFIEPSTEGKCPFCKKHVKNLEAHTKIKHMGEKLVK